MKTLIIFFIVLVGIFCKSQEINDRKIDIMIKSLSEEISLLDNNFLKYQILQIVTILLID